MLDYVRGSFFSKASVVVVMFEARHHKIHTINGRTHIDFNELFKKAKNSINGLTDGV